MHARSVRLRAPGLGVRQVCLSVYGGVVRWLGLSVPAPVCTVLSTGSWFGLRLLLVKVPITYGRCTPSVVLYRCTEGGAGRCTEDTAGVRLVYGGIQQVYGRSLYGQCTAGVCTAGVLYGQCTAGVRHVTVPDRKVRYRDRVTVLYRTVR